MGLFDPEGLGAETRRPLIPQELACLPLQSFSIKLGRFNSIKKPNPLKNSHTEILSKQLS
ncbi:hypothetical protein ACQCVP_20905 [Rossellomorea vietnamensis]